MRLGQFFGRLQIFGLRFEFEDLAFSARPDGFHRHRFGSERRSRKPFFVQEIEPEPRRHTGLEDADFDLAFGQDHQRAAVRPVRAIGGPGTILVRMLMRVLVRMRMIMTPVIVRMAMPRIALKVNVEFNA